MNAESLIFWLSLIGSLASVVGLPIAIWQIVKARTAAEASKLASIDTRNTISRNIVLTELMGCLRLIADLKTALRIDNFELAEARIGDLIRTVIQVREDLPESEFESVFSESLPQMTILRDKIEQKVLGQSAKIAKGTISQLSKFADDLTRLIGKLRTNLKSN